MRPNFNYTTPELYAIRDFKEKVKNSYAGNVRFIYAFIPNGLRNEDDYLLYTHIVRAVNDAGKYIDSLNVATNVQL